MPSWKRPGSSLLGPPWPLGLPIHQALGAAGNPVWETLQAGVGQGRLDCWPALRVRDPSLDWDRDGCSNAGHTHFSSSDLALYSVLRVAKQPATRNPFRFGRVAVQWWVGDGSSWR